MFVCDVQNKKHGVLIAGLGGNNGSAFWALHSLRTLSRKFTHHFNMYPVYGSLLMCGDVSHCIDQNSSLRSLLAECKLPCALEDVQVIDGWEAKKTNMRDALLTNAIVAPNLVLELCQHKPRVMSCEIEQGVVYPEFVGLSLDAQRGASTEEDIERVTADIDLFAKTHELDSMVIVYSGCTESNTQPGVKPSQVYAYAAARSNVHASFINAAAQCTLTPELLAEFDSKGRIALGNDLCTGQTRLKHALLGTFVAQGIPVQTVVNFNTLGNNDGLNLASQHTNASKITSKASTCERLAQFAPTLYHAKNVDQLVQIAYVPSIGDNKRAMDEYILELPLSHKMDMFINTVCPDTALALGVLTDLVLMSIILGHTTVQKYEKRPITCMQANALCACLLKSPVSPHARLYFQECRDVLTGFLVELCGKNPETLRHRGLF